jgi:hypothetical protein
MSMFDMSSSRDFRHRGLSAAQLDEMIDAHKMHRLDEVINESAKLLQENTRFQQRPGVRIDAKTIGQLIEYILDEGFFCQLSL